MTGICKRTARRYQLTNQTDETLLLSKVAKGDEVAFKSLFDIWYPYLAAHIFRITQSRELAEEIVQDVFLKIWQSRETLAGVVHFRAYLTVVSRNHALNAIRKIARDSRKQQQWVYENREQPDGKDTIYYSLIDEAIDQLTPRQREIYLLHRHKKLTYNQIAEQLHLSRETVKSHLQLATMAIKNYVLLKIGAFAFFCFF